MTLPAEIASAFLTLALMFWPALWTLWRNRRNG